MAVEEKEKGERKFCRVTKSGALIPYQILRKIYFYVFIRHIPTVYIQSYWRDMLHIIHYSIYYAYISAITLNYLLSYFYHIYYILIHLYIYI